MDNDEVISTLNDLIETSKDGQLGFREAAMHATDERLRQTLENYAQKCSVSVRELQELVLKNGGDPVSGRAIGGVLHRRWLDIKSVMLGEDDEGILDECERGEDVALYSYRSALDRDLPDEIRRVIQRQFSGVLHNHDQIKTLRDQRREHS